MLKLISIFIAFGLGATLGYYTPLQVGGVKHPGILFYFEPLLKKETDYRQRNVTGIITSVDSTAGEIALSYHPGYTRSDTELIKLNFDGHMKIDERRTTKQDGIIIFWEKLPETIDAGSLKTGEAVRIIFTHNEDEKQLLVSSILRLNKDIKEL